MLITWVHVGGSMLNWASLLSTARMRHAPEQQQDNRPSILECYIRYFQRISRRICSQHGHLSNEICLIRARWWASRRWSMCSIGTKIIDCWILSVTYVIYNAFHVGYVLKLGTCQMRYAELGYRCWAQQGWGMRQNTIKIIDLWFKSVTFIIYIEFYIGYLDNLCTCWTKYARLDLDDEHNDDGACAR